MFKKILPVFCILIMLTGFIMAPGTESGTAKKIHSSEAGLDKKPVVTGQAEILPVIKGAVEDDTWLLADDKNEVNRILSKYYSGSLLDKLTEDVWSFIKEPTDWYSKASVKTANIEYYDERRAVVQALIDVEDVLTEGRQQGSAVFTLEKDNTGWRVIYASYRWTGRA